MKKITLLFLSCLSATLLVAQNTFPTSGNVGIGTTAPSSKLEIVGDNTDDDIVSIQNNNYSRLAIYSASNSANPLPFVMGYRSRGTVSSPSTVQTNDRLFGVYANTYVNGAYRVNAAIEMKAGSQIGSSNYSSYMIFATTSGTSRQERMRITQDGNVGIGTSNPDTYKLAVNGSVRAKEVVVETGWADFVFENDYELRTLEEVESFIKENGHLPEVPSANVVQEEGVKVGEAQTMLLQKIEELTLYTIDQQKQIESLKADIASLAGKQQ